MFEGSFKSSTFTHAPIHTCTHSHIYYTHMHTNIGLPLLWLSLLLVKLTSVIVALA